LNLGAALNAKSKQVAEIRWAPVQALAKQQLLRTTTLLLLQRPLQEHRYRVRQWTMKRPLAEQRLLLDDAAQAPAGMRMPPWVTARVAVRGTATAPKGSGSVAGKAAVATGAAVVREAPRRKTNLAHAPCRTRS
jgi:hypothetical protein